MTEPIRPCGAGKNLMLGHLGDDLDHPPLGITEHDAVSPACSLLFVWCLKHGGTGSHDPFRKRINRPTVNGAEPNALQPTTGSGHESQHMVLLPGTAQENRAVGFRTDLVQPPDLLVKRE